MSIDVKYNYAPQILQKKRYSGKLPNTYRVLNEDAYFWDSRPSIRPVKVIDCYTPIPSTIPETIISCQPKRDLRHNNPQSLYCNFMLHNARTLNAPLCYVKTKLDCGDNANAWYNFNYIDKPISVPKKSLESTSRSDYKEWKTQSVNTRHSSNSTFHNKSENIVSHNYFGKSSGRNWKENISFEHEYNSRQNNNYPMRGKRHGSFVWNKIDAYFVDEKENQMKPITNNGYHGDLQHKYACSRQFASSRFLKENFDSVSRLIQPDVDSGLQQNSYLPIFTH